MNKYMFDVVTIGSATRDVFLDASFLPQTLGKDKNFLLPLGAKLEIKKVYFTVGGNAVNSAITFSRNNLKTACVGCVGDDASGREIIKKLKEEKVNTDFMEIDKNLRTATSFLLIKNGERTILGYPGASHNFKYPRNIEKISARFWYISLSGNSYRFFKKFVLFAKKKNIFVAFNPTGYHIKMAREEILDLLPYVSFLVLNKEEAESLLGEKKENMKKVFKKLDKKMPGILAITDGKNGAMASDGKYIYKVGIFKEKVLVDRTGAGDAFGSGFVLGLIQNGIDRSNVKNISPQKMCEALRIASANSVSVVEKLGATEGILFPEDLKSRRFKKLNIEVVKI